MLNIASILLLCMVSCLAEPSLSVRLTTPLTSYDARSVVQFSTVVIAPYSVNGEIKLPAGTIVRGVVSKTRRVGFGLVRERATLGLKFQEYELPDGRRFPIEAVLRHVDNAREKVDAQGHIKGILAANSPQSLIGGLWHMPDFDRFTRSFIGMTGAGGRVASHFAMGPAGMAGVFAARCIIFRLPEPEIQLKAGTEMFLRVNQLSADAPTFQRPAATPVPDDLGDALATAPLAITKPKGVAAADIVNVALVGSREEVVSAFEAAGWVEAEVMNAGSLSRMYKAYAAQRGYASAPVSKLFYETAEPEMVFQKSLNTIEQRHHIRIWKSEMAGREVWLGAATHDVGVKFESNWKFSHRIYRRIDHERSKVINDLSFAGCVAPAGFVDRPDAIRTSGSGDTIETDGRMAVLFLHSACSNPSKIRDEMPEPPKSKVSLMARRMLLEGRQYVLRGNPYYWSYRVIAMRRTESRLAGIEE